MNGSPRERNGARLEDLLVATADRYPARPAMVDAWGSLSWRDLAAGVERARAGLAAAGLRPGEVVALSLPNGAAFVSAFLAVASLDGVALPLHPDTNQAEAEDALARARARWRVAREEEEGACPDGPRFLRYSDLLRRGSSPILRGEGDPGRTAILLLASGSTGRPRLIPRTHANLVAESRQFAGALRVLPEDAILAAVSLQHARGLGHCLLASLGTGAKLVLAEGSEHARTVEAIRRERVTLLPGPTAQFAALAGTPGIATADLASVRVAFSAGAPLAPGVFEGFLGRFGIPVRRLFGCSEAGSVSIDLDPNPSRTAGSVGRPMEGVGVEVRRPDGSRCGAGVSGEIAIRGPALSPGYLGDAERNVRQFRRGWFFPGDLGWFDGEGRLWIEGRTTSFADASGKEALARNGLRSLLRKDLSTPTEGTSAPAA
ncbi:MAG TPA: long-chain fatty acid--CoA ligase [Planctomycetota bacterium]|jgi:long-chain acyl-CoA synthetase|nr:long-chain fatty acid--CoA ligase [Planctomycetota bacterium]